VKIVEVSWLDTLSDTGWFGKSRRLDPKDMLQHSIGYLIENTTKQVVICQSRSEILDNYAERLQIPKCAVKKVKIIRRDK